MEEMKIYLELPDEVNEYLLENGISMEEFLKKENIQTKVDYSELPSVDESSKSKDLVLAIYGGAAILSGLILAVNKILDMADKDYAENIETEIHLLKDKKGNFILDEKGKAKYFTTKKVIADEVEREISVKAGLSSIGEISVGFKSKKKFK